MLEEGKITADDALKLLDTLTRGTARARQAQKQDDPDQGDE